MRFPIQNNSHKQAPVEYIQNLDATKIQYVVEVKRVRKQRSHDQNGLYWMWLSCLSAETGNDKEDLHTYFREYFLGYADKKMFGDTIRKVRSTSDLDTKQFTDYLEKIKTWSSRELGIALPDPHEAYFESFKEIYQNYI